MKQFRIILTLFVLLPLCSCSQKLYGNWELKNVTFKGGKPETLDKMLGGDGLELHLGHKSHLAITVFHNEGEKVKHKNTWYESDEFIILNDQEWGNATYAILEIDNKVLVLERMLVNGIEMILSFERKNLKNHHYNYKTEIKSN